MQYCTAQAGQGAKAEELGSVGESCLKTTAVSKMVLVSGNIYEQHHFQRKSTP